MESVNYAVNWTVEEQQFAVHYRTLDSMACQQIKRKYSFADKPLSEEELHFPLAYGLLVYDNAVQLYFLLSALYQPQNQFCIAVDENASELFKSQVQQLSACFSNIFVLETPQVSWCGFSVLQGVYSCVEYLAKLPYDWKYYQYLSGVDLPLKTNLEMVRIFKQLNGSFNSGIYDLENSTRVLRSLCGNQAFRPPSPKKRPCS
uniref:Core-2/I-Branching enzyme n=1 Tax=Steinernema glaseri TaxID=37863 RepID=A0A1I8AFW1_9BILA